MGQKMHPDATRLGVINSWKSLWYAEGDNYIDKLHSDIKIRDHVNERLQNAGIESVEIVRSSNMITVKAYVARPGVAIGRGGEAIDLLKKELSKITKTNVEIKINEVKKSEMSAKVMAQNIVNGLENRQSPKRLMIAEKEKAIQAGAKGVRIWISGDFGVPKQSRVMKVSEGSIPLQTLRAAIDYADMPALIRNAGLHGVKVWVYKGETEEEEKEEK